MTLFNTAVASARIVSLNYEQIKPHYQKNFSNGPYPNPQKIISSGLTLISPITFKMMSSGKEPVLAGELVSLSL